MSMKLDTSEIEKYVLLGWEDKDWYQECQMELEDIFGKENLYIVTRMLAATSINTGTKGNITLFRRAYGEYLRGDPISNYLPNIQKQLDHLRNGRDLSGRKIRAFAQAMSGDPYAVVVDIWILRAFKMNRRYYRKASQSVREGGATDKQFTLIEDWITVEAAIWGLQPRELCAMIWSGIRRDQNGIDKTRRYTDILKVDYKQSLFNYGTI